MSRTLEGEGMTLYLLEWDNHESYDDREVTLLGVYLTAKERDKAIDRYNAYPRQWPFRDWTPGGLTELSYALDSTTFPEDDNRAICPTIT